MASNVNVELRIMGDNFNPDIITNELGIEAKEKWRQNEKSKNYGVIQKYDCWLYKTGYKDVYDVNDLLKDIYSIFNEKRIQIKKLIEKNNLEISLDIIIKMKNNDTPALYFDKEIIDFIHSINAKIDIDMYIE